MTDAGTDAGEFILIGKVAKPHGVRGEVKIYPFSGQPENFSAYRSICITGGDSKQDKLPVEIEKSRAQGKYALLKLAGCSTREDAERLTGSEVWLARSELPELDSTEYYWLELEGKRVISEDGLELGTITAIFETGAHDILQVESNSGEYLIPFHEDFVVSLDGMKVVMKLPPGLLEING